VTGNGSKPADPLAQYQTWLKGITEAQEQFARSSGNPQDLWKRWFETATEVWRKAAEAESDPLGLTTQWVEMMEEARARLLAGARVPVDPFTYFKEWYDATNETWSRLMGEIIGTERFMESASEFLKSYTGFYAAMRRANEEYFRNLQIPTRSDIARVAGLVVNLEEKVDHIDGALEDFEDGAESNLSQLPAVLQKLETVEHLGQRVEGLEKRLDRVEGKLDAMLTALEKLAAVEHPAAAKPGEASRSRARRSSTELKQGSPTAVQGRSRASQ